MIGRHRSVPPRPPLPAVTRSGRAGRSMAGQRLDARLATHGTHSTWHRRGLRRLAGGFAAMAVVGASLSLVASPGQALDTPPTEPTEPAAADPGFVGFSSTSTASPLKIEIFEPTIPLPAEPQLEVSLGYTKVLADSAGTRSRASYLWPGDPVGEGFKTIAEQLGLPPELGDAGYPVQVNAMFPSGPESQAEEPLPGMIQRAVAGDDTARADNGFSTDGEPTSDDEGGGLIPGVPGIPGLPAIPGLPGLSGLTTSLNGLLGGGGRSTTAADSPAGSTGSTGSARVPTAAMPALPEPLSSLVDLGGFTSTSRTSNTEEAFAEARSVLGDVSLLGGLVKIEGVKTVATARSDGKVGTPVGRTAYGDIVVAGQRFAYGPDGFEASGSIVPIPGFPSQGAALLKRLGVSISTPKPVVTKDGDAATTAIDGLVIDIDLKVLRAQITPLTDALNDLVTMLPDQLGPLKSAVQAVANLAPRIVVRLGTSSASVDTSQAIDVPPLPETPPVTPPATEDPAPIDTGDTGGTGDAGDVPLAPVDPGSVDPAAPAGDTPTTEATTPVSGVTTPPGLPALLSFPGLLLYGGLLGAAVAGFFVRRLGALALGAAGSCPHGLTSGLPDLRKA